MEDEYNYIIVESHKPKSTSGLHGEIHIRPIKGQNPYLESMHVRCSKELSEDYAVGTKFRIKAKITNKEGGNLFIHSHYTWPYVVLK